MAPDFDPTVPIDIQTKLDEWLASNPDAQKYVTKLWYLREDGSVPPEVTHFIRLQSDSSFERALTIGLVVVPQFAAFIDMLLSVLATSPSS